MVDFLNFLNFAVFLYWTEGLLDQMSRKQKKKKIIMTMYSAFHPKVDVAKNHLTRKEGVSGVISVEDTVKSAILGLERYILTNKKSSLMTAGRLDGDYG